MISSNVWLIAGIEKCHYNLTNLLDFVSLEIYYGKADFITVLFKLCLQINLFYDSWISW